ncbi:hypothetical protein OEZ86_004288 [Tetradesmus obliquus]|nr:hypothetical protein OEZ86_004288 [Tetradesmus obliquus]
MNGGSTPSTWQHCLRTFAERNAMKLGNPVQDLLEMKGSGQWWQDLGEAEKKHRFVASISKNHAHLSLWDPTTEEWALHKKSSRSATLGAEAGSTPAKSVPTVKLGQLQAQQVPAKGSAVALAVAVAASLAAASVANGLTAMH